MGHLDDPTFNPEQAVVLPRIAQVAEDVRWLIASGLDRVQIAQRLGISRDYVDRALREIPDPDQEPAA